ncbi:MAG: flavin reductase [Emcibacteraceae bacterium]|nr:flavin reductase [Emcibacteraceae bacterium]MDG1857634.1 flavin reductase [Emcibacteraceae bacterium]
MTKIDAKELRNCFGKFATGITVITAVSPDGLKIGLTVNSFSSLSIDPPMILWSLDNNSHSLEALKATSHFAVNVLASDQMDLSNNFASREDDKFDNVDTFEGKCGLPLLVDTVSHLECKNVHQYPGGDHTIFVGEVEHFEISNKKPLLYTNGQYGLAARHPSNRFPEPTDVEAAQDDDFIVLLLLRSYWEISDPFHRELLDEGIPVSHARILVHISQTPNMTPAEIAQSTRIDMATVSMSISWLSDNGQLNLDNDQCITLSDKGKEFLNSVKRRAQRFEDEVLDGYSDQEIEMLKTMLRKLIHRKDV